MGRNWIYLPQVGAKQDGEVLMYNEDDSQLEWAVGTVEYPTADNLLVLSDQFWTPADLKLCVELPTGDQECIPLVDLVAMHKQWKTGQEAVAVPYYTGGQPMQIWSVSGILSILLISIVGGWLLRKITLRRVVRGFLHMVYRPAQKKVSEAEQVWKEESGKE